MRVYDSINTRNNSKPSNRTQNSEAQRMHNPVHVKSFSEANRLIGRKVAWKSGENRIIGKIVALHGKKGLVRARFRRGVPSQALGTTVELVG